MNFTIVFDNDSYKMYDTNFDVQDNYIKFIFKDNGDVQIKDFQLELNNDNQNFVDKIISDIVMNILFEQNINIYSECLSKFGKTRMCLVQFVKQILTKKFPITGKIDIQHFVDKYTPKIFYGNVQKLSQNEIMNPICYKCKTKSDTMFIATDCGRETIRCSKCIINFKNKRSQLPTDLWNIKKIEK